MDTISIGVGCHYAYVLFNVGSHTYNGLPITFREDGYINMTKAAKAFGKQLNNFWKSPETKAYLGALQDALGASFDLKVARNGNQYTPGAGTYCHPKLAVFFARWLDVRFAVWCDLMIDNILKGHIQTQVVVATEEALKVAPQKPRNPLPACV